MKQDKPPLRKRRILFTGGGGAGNELIFRLWNDRYELHFADADGEAFSPVIPSEQRHPIPFAREDHFAAAVACLCRQQEIDLLVPGVDEELPLMPDVEALAPGLLIMIPDAGYVTTTMDKLAVMEVLEDKGVDVPRTATIDQHHRIGFPCIAKPRWGRGSRGVQVLSSEEEAEAYRCLSGETDENLLVQELLEGEEYTVMMAANAQKHLHAVVPVRVAVKRGITLRAQSDPHGLVIRACDAIHRAVPASGCYNIQLFLTPDKRVVPIEINPRVSTTFCLGVAAGIDPVAIFLEDAPPDGLLSFRGGVRLKRHWTNYLCLEKKQKRAD